MSGNYPTKKVKRKKLKTKKDSGICETISKGLKNDRF